MTSMTMGCHATSAPTADRIAAELEAFVRERFEVAEDDPRFHHGTHLWEEGYVDSTGAAELIAHLEEHYALTIPDDMLFDPEFTTLAGMARCVASLLGAPRAGLSGVAATE